MGLVVGLQLLSATAQAQQSAAPEEACNELSAIVNAVGARLKKSLQIDPRVHACVQGRVDVPSMSYRDLQALLALHGFIDTMELDGIIQIVPDAIARQLPLRLIDDRTRDVGEFEMVMKVVDTAPLNAAQLVPVLRPLLSQYSHLVADIQTNSMIVVTRYGNVRTLENLLRALKVRPLVPLSERLPPARPMSDKDKVRDEAARSASPPR
jgi:general secretion pathway protein D